MELSSRSPWPSSARAREANTAVPSASPRSWARNPRWIAITAGIFPSMLAAFPTDGSNGSSTAGAAPASVRSAASSGGSIASARPRVAASSTCASNSRVRVWTSSAGSAASHRCAVAPSLRRYKIASKCCSISRAAQAVSPAARACPTASSASPCSSYQAAAARCSTATRPGRCCCTRARSRSANRRWYRHQPRTSSSGIRNRPACSMCSSIACPSARPVTASHSPPLRRSSTEVSSRNSRTCSGWPSRTSPVR